MTLKEIHAMFKVGQEWDAINTLHPKLNGRRVVKHVKTKEIEWVKGFSPIPSARAVIEARDGYLKYMLFPDAESKLFARIENRDATVELRRVEVLF